MVGLLNTSLPLTVIVFVIKNVKWFIAMTMAINQSKCCSAPAADTATLLQRRLLAGIIGPAAGRQHAGGCGRALDPAAAAALPLPDGSAVPKTDQSVDQARTNHCAGALSVSAAPPGQLRQPAPGAEVSAANVPPGWLPRSDCF